MNLLILKNLTSICINLENQCSHIWPCYFMANRTGKGGNSDRLPLLGLWNHCGLWLQPWNQMTAPWQESYDKPRQGVEKQRHCSANRGPYSQGCGLPSGYVWLWEKDHNEGGAPTNWCLWTAVLEKTPENPLDGKKTRPENPKGNQPWTCWKDRCWSWNSSILVNWYKKLTHWKVPDAGKDEGRRRRHPRARCRARHLECKVKWALGSITMNKANGGDWIPAELFKVLKDNAVKVVHSICQQIWKTQQWPQDWKRSVFIPIPKKGNTKEYISYHTIALISHASK